MLASSCDFFCNIEEVSIIDFVEEEKLSILLLICCNVVTICSKASVSCVIRFFISTAAVAFFCAEELILEKTSDMTIDKSIETESTRTFVKK